MKKAIWAALLAVIFVVSSLTSSSKPALGLDRVQWLFGMNPPSQWLDFNERQQRLAFGQLIFTMVGNTNGFYHNLTVAAAGGLNVSVGPTSANTVGSLYQYLAEETTAFGGFPAGIGTSALPTDPTQVFLQGLLQSNTANIGPLTPPGTGGQSIDFVIECQVQTQDVTQQVITLVSTSGVVSQSNAKRDRVDTIICQAKAGAAAATGSQVAPATDAGWVCVAIVAVANGTVTITGGMITAYQPFQGFATPYVDNTGAPPLHPGHHVYMPGQLAVTTGSCANNAACGLSSGGTVSFSGSAVFFNAPACRGTATGSTAVSVVPYNTTTGSIAFAFYNISGGAITTGTTITYSMDCDGV